MQYRIQSILHSVLHSAKKCVTIGYIAEVTPSDLVRSELNEW